MFKLKLILKRIAKSKAVIDSKIRELKDILGGNEKIPEVGVVLMFIISCSIELERLLVHVGELVESHTKSNMAKERSDLLDKIVSAETRERAGILSRQELNLNILKESVMREKLEGKLQKLEEETQKLKEKNNKLSTALIKVRKVSKGKSDKHRRKKIEIDNLHNKLKSVNGKLEIAELSKINYDGSFPQLLEIQSIYYEQFHQRLLCTVSKLQELLEGSSLSDQYDVYLEKFEKIINDFVVRDLILRYRRRTEFTNDEFEDVEGGFEKFNIADKELVILKSRLETLLYTCFPTRKFCHLPQILNGLFLKLGNVSRISLDLCSIFGTCMSNSVLDKILVSCKSVYLKKLVLRFGIPGFIPYDNYNSLDKVTGQKSFGTDSLISTYLFNEKLMKRLNIFVPGKIYLTGAKLSDLIKNLHLLPSLKYFPREKNENMKLSNVSGISMEDLNSGDMKDNLIMMGILFFLKEKFATPEVEKLMDVMSGDHQTFIFMRKTQFIIYKFLLKEKDPIKLRLLNCLYCYCHFHCRRSEARKFITDYLPKTKKIKPENIIKVFYEKVYDAVHHKTIPTTTMGFEFCDNLDISYAIAEVWKEEGFKNSMFMKYERQLRFDGKEEKEIENFHVKWFILFFLEFSLIRTVSYDERLKRIKDLDDYMLFLVEGIYINNTLHCLGYEKLLCDTLNYVDYFMKDTVNDIDQRKALLKVLKNTRNVKIELFHAFLRGQ